MAAERVWCMPVKQVVAHMIVKPVDWVTGAPPALEIPSEWVASPAAGVGKLPKIRCHPWCSKPVVVDTGVLAKDRTASYGYGLVQ